MPPRSVLALSGAGLREFLEAVLERGVPFRFTARGWSMYPFIRDCDVITVAPLGARQPCIGEVAALRRGSRLLVHRLVRAADGGYESRGDNCLMSDGFVPAEAVLGVVTQVERAGRPARLGTGPEGALLARLSRAGALRPLTRCGHVPRRAAADALRRAQRAPACRRVLRRLRPTCTVERASPADDAELTRRFGLRAVLSSPPDGMEVTAFVARMRRGGARIVGYAELQQRGVDAAPFDGSWIRAVVVATPFRGMGIAEALVCRTVAAAQEAGAGELQVTVGADNAPALALCRKLGFVAGGSPALVERLAADARRGDHRRVALRLAVRRAEARVPEPAS